MTDLNRPKSLSVKRRLALGFGVLVVLLTLSGAVSLWQIDRIDTALMQIVNVEEPLEEAVLEMEIHAGETARAVLHHIHEPSQKFRTAVHESENEFQAYSTKYEELVENEQERQIGREVLQTYSEFKNLGDELISISTERKEKLLTLRTDVAQVDKALATISEGLVGAHSRDDVKKLASVLRMEVEIEKAFAVVEAYTAMHDPEMKEELGAAISRFQHQVELYRQTELSEAEMQTLEELKQQFSSAIAAARKAIALTDQLHGLSNHFEDDLVEMDRVLDDEIQPLIHAETVRAAEDAMNSSRRAITLLACLSVLGVISGGFLGWHISRGITEPVSRLVKGTKIIGQGDREHRIEIGTQDEFGELASAFNGMVDSLNHSADELLQSQQEAERLKLQAAQREIEQHAAEARTDQLTQLHNRRAFDDMLAHQAEDCSSHGDSVAVLLFDIDKFKLFNDNHGHQAGDAVLQGVASTLASAFQTPDCVFRFGGEEFAAILPSSTLTEAAQKAEQARKAVEQAEYEFNGTRLNVTASGGAALLADVNDSEDAIRLADDALYASKDAGRNCIHLHNGSSILPAAEELVNTPY